MKIHYEYTPEYGYYIPLCILQWWRNAGDQPSPQWPVTLNKTLVTCKRCLIHLATDNWRDWIYER